MSISLGDAVHASLQRSINAAGSPYTSGTASLHGGVLLGGARHKMPSTRAASAMSRMLSRVSAGSYGGAESHYERSVAAKRGWKTRKSHMRGGREPDEALMSRILNAQRKVGRVRAAKHKATTARRSANRAAERVARGCPPKMSRSEIGKMARLTFIADALKHCKAGDLDTWLRMSAKEKRALLPSRGRWRGCADQSRHVRGTHTPAELREALESGMGAGFAKIRGYRGGNRKSAAHSPWIRYVKSIRAQHPRMSYKMALKAAAKSYKKMGGVLLGGKRKKHRRGGVLLGGSGVSSGKDEEKEEEKDGGYYEYLLEDDEDDEKYGDILEKCYAAEDAEDEDAEMEAYIADILGEDGDADTEPFRIEVVA